MPLDHTKLDRKTNAELLRIIIDDDVSVGDRAFSLDWNQPVYFDGVTFKSYCGCNAIRLPVIITTGIKVNGCCLQVNGCQLVLTIKQ